MVILVWLINFGISWLNAWGCGKTWTESKHAGGVPHFLNWCGAIMSAAGFTWCYLVVLGGAATIIPVEADDGTTAPLLSGASAAAFADLGYMLVVFPIVGSGLALTVHSWGVFWRERNFASGATAGWNSFAQVYNTMSALQHVPQASRRLGAFFGGDGEKDKAKGLVVLLVALAAIGGILTTRAILLSTARATAFNRGLRYSFRAEA
jgi:hypothetical protein